MYNLKKTLFLNLTSRQKSSLLSFLSGLVKKNPKLGAYEILDKFLEDEIYYNKIEQTHFHFVIENIENEKFINEILKFIEATIHHIEYFEPIINKRKQIEKEQRKRAQEYKMAREKPTLKQIKYYEKITKAHNIEMKDVKNASKLDLRNWIMEILGE